MKTKLFLLCAAAIMMASCQKEASNGGATGTVNVPIKILNTKAAWTQDADDATKTLTSAQVFIFKGTERVEYVYAYTAETIAALKASLSATEEGISYTFYAVLNNMNGSGVEKVAISECLTPDALKAKTVDLNQLGASDIVIAGSKTQLITTAENQSVSIDADRIVAKIEIKDITCDFSAASGLQNKELIIQEIFIENAQKKATLGLAGAAATADDFYNIWTSKPEGDPQYPGYMTFEDGLETFLRDKDLNQTIQTTAGAVSTYKANKFYLTLPNAGGIKKTMLVIKASLGGTVGYYAINLHALKTNTTQGSLSANYSYIINKLTIKSNVGPTPDIPTASVDVSLNVKIVDWKTGASEDVDI